MPQVLLLIIVAILLMAPSASASPLEYRIWQLQDYNMPHMKRLVNMAAEQGVNRVQLSHQIIMDSEEAFKKPQLVKDINEICDYAHARGVKVDIWTHELNGVPDEFRADGKANLDDPKLWQWVKDKYSRLFQLCPNVDGLVLTMQETAMSIYHEHSVSSSIPPEKRVARLIDDMAEVCKSLGKTFFVRTFSYQPSELQYICSGLKESKSDVIVMSKCVPHDWQPFYPNNPAIGDIGNHPQIVEFDMGYEFCGLSTIPYIDLFNLKDRLDYGLAKGIVGAVLRVERLKWRAVDTPNWANIEVFTKLMRDPSADDKQLFYEWVAARYGDKAAPYVVPALSRTFDIVNLSYFALGFWVTNHSLLPDYGYAQKSLTGRTSAKWDKRKKIIEQALFNPTWKTVAKIDEEKDTAMRLVNESLADIEKAKPYLSSSDYAQLKDLMERERAMVEVWKEGLHTFFAIRIAEDTGSAEDKAKAVEAAGRLKASAERNRRHLINMAADYARPANEANLNGAEALIKKAHEVAGK